MTDGHDDAELYQPLLDELNKFDERLREGPTLVGREEETTRTLRYGLRTSSLQFATFKYLAWTSTEFTVALVDDLVDIARQDRYTGAMQKLLGRLRYEQARELVPPAVFKLLESEYAVFGPADDRDWNQMATLLHDLGLFEALRELVRRAHDHIDPDVRDVADTFAERVSPPQTDPDSR